MHPKDADGLTNSVDPDLSLHCLLKLINLYVLLLKIFMVLAVMNFPNGTHYYHVFRFTFWAKIVRI